MTAMLLTKINLDDVKLLDQLRIRRLRSFFTETLLHCAIRCDRTQTLIVHCLEASIVDTVLSDLEELCSYAWLILGVEAIALYFAQEEIYRTKICAVHQKIIS